MADLSKVKQLLLDKGKDVSKVEKAIAYLSGSDQAQRHNDTELYSLVAKYLNAGVNLDGVNVVLTGKNMGLITFHGYMNKVKALHSNVFFDIQLVREGDEFKFSKENGSVVYNHSIGNPFEDKKIIGAYCVVKLNNNSGDESLELLNDTDFQKMKSSSRNSATWNKWESEFWRKSVIKRACKVYFAEEVSELEVIDNEDYGLSEDERPTPNDVKAKIIAANKKDKK